MPKSSPEPPAWVSHCSFPDRSYFARKMSVLPAEVRALRADAFCSALLSFICTAATSGKYAVAEKAPVTYRLPSRSTLTVKPPSVPLPPKEAAEPHAGVQANEDCGMLSRMALTRQPVTTARRKCSLNFDKVVKSMIRPLRLSAIFGLGLLWLFTLYRRSFPIISAPC